MGVVDRHGFHPMRCHEYGRALLLDANEWRTILRGRSESHDSLPFVPLTGLIYLEGTRAAGLWTPRSLADGMVELARASHRCSVGRLCDVSHDSCRSVHWKPGICPRKLPNFPPHRNYYVHSCMHQQHANPMDCEFQLGRVEFEHCRIDHCDYSHSSSNQSRSPRFTKILLGKRGVGKFLRGNRFPKWPCSTHDFCRSDLDDEVILIR